MEQLAHQITFLNDFLPYKYTIDTCSILSQKDDDTHPRSIEKSLWDDIEQMMRDHVRIRQLLPEISKKCEMTITNMFKLKASLASSSDDSKPEHIEIIGFSMRKMRFANKLLTVDF